MKAIQCKYSCFQCGLKMRVVSVPVRGADENVVEFTNRAATAASRDHDRMSPTCKITKLSELMIPIAENTPVGGLPPEAA